MSSGSNIGKRIVFISGLQGAGKSALAEALKTKHGFAHFDGDLWSLGADPLGGDRPQLQGKEAEVLQERKKSITEFLLKFRAEEASVADEPQAYSPFYEAMCTDALAVASALPPDHPGLIVAHAVYRRSMRDFIRDKLSTSSFSVTYLEITTPVPDVATERAAQRCVAQYAAMDKKVEEWMTLLQPNRSGYQEVLEEEMTDGMVTVINDAGGGECRGASGACRGGTWPGSKRVEMTSNVQLKLEVIVFHITTGKNGPLICHQVFFFFFFFFLVLVPSTCELQNLIGSNVQEFTFCD